MDTSEIPDMEFSNSPTDEIARKLLEEKINAARKLVEEVSSLREYVKALPDNLDDARKKNAIERFNEVKGSLDAFAPADMEPLQIQAAVLLGQGLRAEEIAKELNIPGGAARIHQWRQDKRFRELMRYWREVAEEEQLAMVFRELDVLGRLDLDARNRLALIALRLKVGERTENRGRWEKEIELREREVAAKEREASRRLRERRPSWLQDPLGEAEVLDGEFEVDESESD